MATKNTEKNENMDSLTMPVVKEDKKYKGPYVTVFLPALDSNDSMAVDQYEHVTIANEVREDCYQVKRGEWVEVPYPVFRNLKERYPKL